VGLWAARGSGLVGLSAASAIIAHAGPAGLADPGLLTVALAGALIAAVVLGAGAVAGLGARRLASALTADDLARAGARARVMPVSGSAVLPAMLACQGAAHIALLVAGVPMAGTQAGTLAVHVVAGVLAALIWLGIDRVVGRCFGQLEAAIASLLSWLRSQAEGVPAPPTADHPAGVRLGIFGLPRGPPVRPA
jgi:hypothetical protein